MKRPGMQFAVSLAALLLLLPGPRAAAAIRVVATVFPIADMVRQVAGAEAVVLELLPPGATPHAFEPVPGTLRSRARSPRKKRSKMWSISSGALPMPVSLTDN